MKKTQVKDRATQYAEDVCAGRIIAGPYVRGACKRHLTDLKNADNRGYYFDPNAAEEAMAFFEEVLVLNGDDFEGLPFILLPWQCFIVGSLYGWKRINNDARRFTLAYIETGKGSGKSPLAAGIGIKGLVNDGVKRAEIYACATLQDQAMILFRDACAFYDQSPELQERLKPSGVGEFRWNLAYPEQNSFFRVISSEKSKSGYRVYIYIADEVHEHKDGTLINLLRKGFKRQKQPLGVEITNSGSNTASFCFERHEMCRKISLGMAENDEVFCYICALDDEDIKDKNGEESEQYLYNESVWIKVNPSIEYGLPGYEYVRKQVREASGMPSQMATVKRLNFCQWVASDNPWLSGELWFGCQDTEWFKNNPLAGRSCVGALDLSSTQDLTAFDLLFEPCDSDPLWRLKAHFWIPGDGLERKAEQDHVPYDVWRDKGFVTALPGKAINKSSVIKMIAETTREYHVKMIAFDRAKMKDLEEFAEKAGIEIDFGKWDKEKREWIFEGNDGIKMVPFGQESRSMDPAVSKFETMLANKQLRHDGNPCLTWCAANAVTVEDEDKNRKISKRKSTGRVDGIVSAVMCAGIIDDRKPGSGYEDRAAKGEEVIRTL